MLTSLTLMVKVGKPEVTLAATGWLNKENEFLGGRKREKSVQSRVDTTVER